jgi:hypothetical protein
LEEEPPEKFEWQFWGIDCYRVSLSTTGQQITPVINLLSDLYFIAQYRLAEVKVGSDLLFWHHYCQSLKNLLLRDQYIPALKYRELELTTTDTTTDTAIDMAKQAKAKANTKAKTTYKIAAKSSSGKSTAVPKAPEFEIYPAWQWLGTRYEEELEYFVDRMPLACGSGFATLPGELTFHDRATLLRHFSQVLLSEIIQATSFPQSFTKKIEGSFLSHCLDFSSTASQTQLQNYQLQKLEQYQQWQQWRDLINRDQADSRFHICFQLQEPPKPEAAWQVVFQVAPKTDPSRRLPLLDF